MKGKMPLSSCCQSGVTSVGNSTKHYECFKCKKACDIYFERNMFDEFIKIWDFIYPIMVIGILIFILIVLAIDINTNISNIIDMIKE